MINNIPSAGSFTGAGDDIPVVKFGGEVVPPSDAPVIEMTPSTVEPVTPPADIAPQEPVVTPPTPPAPAVDTPPVSDRPVFDESHALSFLSEKLGREIKTLDELKPQEAPELDPQLKQIDEWRKRTGRPLEDWVKFQKDPSTISDIDVVRENLLLEYPSLTEEEIQLELKTNYLSTEDDLDDERAMKQLRLKKDATRGRDVLNKMRLELDTATPANYPKEIQEDLMLARQVKENHAKGMQEAEQYNSGLKTAATSFEKLPLSLDEGLTIDFTVPAEDKAKLVDYINTMPRWKNPDGSVNHSAIVEDAVKILNFEKMLKIAYDQGKSAGGADVIADVSNMTLGERQAAQAVNPTPSGYQVEGWDSFIGGSQIKIGRRR